MPTVRQLRFKVSDSYARVILTSSAIDAVVLCAIPNRLRLIMRLISYLHLEFSIRFFPPEADQIRSINNMRRVVS
jgi:hypothetical protein